MSSLPLKEIRELSAQKDAKLHEAVSTFFKINKVKPASMDWFAKMILDMITEAGTNEGMDERQIEKCRLHFAKLVRNNL